MCILLCCPIYYDSAAVHFHCYLVTGYVKKAQVGHNILFSKYNFLTIKNIG